MGWCTRCSVLLRLNRDKKPATLVAWRVVKDLGKATLVSVSLNGFDHVLNDFLGIAKHHHGLVHVEELIV